MTSLILDVEPSEPDRPSQVDRAIVCQDLTKKFLVMDRGDAWRLIFSREPKGSRSFVAVDDVTLTVPKGQFVGILGRNGAGKSTLLRTVGGIFTPFSGAVHVTDRVSGLYELGIAGHDLLTGRRFVRRWLELSGEPAREISGMVDEICEFTELEGYFDLPIRTYSTGMKARLFFATITAVRASIYLIDEVLSVGDEYYSAKCQGRLRRRLSAGASGLFATHDWAAMMRLCSHAIVLENGSVVDSGSAAEVARRYLEPAELIPDVACFAPDIPEVFRSRSQEDAIWRFPIEVSVEGELVFSMSVESFQPYFGWQHVLHVGSTPLIGRPGRYDVIVRVPRLPMRAGRYVINAFLSRSKAGPLGQRIGYAARSWIHGNPIVLEVEGPPVQGRTTHLEFDWSVSRLT